MVTIWKEVFVAESRYSVRVYLEVMRKAMENFGQDTRCSGRDSNRYFTEYKSRALLLNYLVRFHQIDVWLRALKQVVLDGQDM